MVPVTVPEVGHAGFAPPQLFLDLGQGGKFYLFEGPRPKHGWLQSLRRRLFT